MLPTKSSYFFITDVMRRSKWVDYSGLSPVVNTSSPPIPLPQHPKGWRDRKISFGTNAKYNSLNRAFGAELFFIGDGAIICRDAVLRRKGYQEELYILILTKDATTGIFEEEYFGRLDFGHTVNEPRKGITVPSIEGGVIQYLANNDGKKYPIPLDSTNADCIQVLYKGVTLFDRYRYSTINVDIPKSTAGDHEVVAYTIPISFISNEGDSVGIIKGTQQYAEIASANSSWTNSLIDPYCTDPVNSANSPFYSIDPITIKKITGNIVFDVHQRDGNFGVWILIETSLGTRYNILGTPSSYVQYGSSQTVTVPVSVVISLAGNEKIFIIAVTSSTSIHSQSLTWQNSDLFLEFSSINKPTKAYHIQPLQLWRQLVLKMSEGKYTGDSEWLAAHNNVSWSSTDAIRNFSFNYFFGTFDTIDAGGGIYQIKIPSTLANFPDGTELVISEAASNNGGYTVLSTSLSTIGFTIITVLEVLTDSTITGQISSAAALNISVEDFFNDLDCDKPMGLKVVNNVLYVEPLENLYKPDAEIFDVGEITDLKLSYKFDWLCNTGRFGSRSQDYRQRNGRYEFNTTTIFNFPVDVLKKEYTKVLKSRRDCFGLEFERAKIFDKPTTDSTGDNEPWNVDVIKGVSFDFYVGAFLTQDISGSYFISIFPPLNTAVLSPGMVITISGAASNNGNYTIISIGYSVASTDILVVEPVITANLNGTISVTDANLYTPYLELGTISGVLDNTVFNTRLTPHNALLGHGRILNSLMLQFNTEKITFGSANKNADLVVTNLAGTALAEKQSEVIANIGTPLFYPFTANFKTRVPVRFAKIMKSIGTGYIKGTYCGADLYFLPIGQMDAKPAFNEAQVWDMVLAGPEKNSLEILYLLSLEGGFNIDAMGNFIFTSDLNSLHWTKYAYTLPPQYNHYSIHEARQYDRNEGYIQRPVVTQPWQTSDFIPIQCITKGIGQIYVDVYKADGTLFQSYTMNMTAEPGIDSSMNRWDYFIDLSGYPPGIYCPVLSDHTTILRQSEWLNIQSKHKGTLLIKYSHSNNRLNYFFSGVEYTPTMRVYAKLLAEYPDSTFTEYDDELADYEILDGIPVQKQLLRLGNAKGSPDYTAMKMNMMLLLNRFYADGHHITRTPDSKVQPNKIQGSPLYSYDIEVIAAHTNYGLVTDETGSGEDLFAAATPDAQAFGEAPDGAVIEIDVPLTP